MPPTDDQPAPDTHGSNAPVGEAPQTATSTGVVRTAAGWFVVNARDARWHHAPGRTAVCDFEDEVPFEQVGVNLRVLQPGEAMSYYHWEADEENFLVLAGEALLIIEGEERPLKRWDFVHCPPKVSHVIVGAGVGQSVVLAVGARERMSDEASLGYPVEPVAIRHGAGVTEEATDGSVAYAGLPSHQPMAIDPAWLAA